MIGISFSLLLLSSAWLQWVIPNVFEVPGRPVLLRFGSYGELKEFLNNSVPVWPYYYGGVRQSVFALAAESTDGAVDYSQTNIQVEGVDEADIVKCDGEYVYLASNERVLIVKAYPPEEAAVVAEIRLNGTIFGMFINEDRLVIFESALQEYVVRTSEWVPIYRDLLTHIRIYNIEDRGNPTMLRSVSADGSYLSSRMIGNYVYLLVNRPAYIEEDKVILPVVVDNYRAEEVSASEIYYANVTDYWYAFTTVVAINVQEDDVEPVHETFLLGASRAIYVSPNNIYLAIPRYDADEGSEKTEIHRLHIEGNKITSEASGEVPGTVLNQFSMNEFQGNFRIATTEGHVARTFDQATSSNHIYVLDTDLTIVGRLENLAKGERIYSARFMGERCYLVTFKKVDPLFVISLEDPANPTVLGKLKIPGYSDYLHPYSENILIGIGKHTIEAEEGDFAWYQGVKISLFDVSDVENPKELDNYIIGDRGTESPVLWDHKALLFDKERNLLAIPVSVAEIDEEKYPEGVPPYTHGDYVWQGVYVFRVTENNVTLRGGITHVEDDSELLKSGYYFYSEYSVQRSLYIEDFLYTISNQRIKINDLTTLQEVNVIELPRNA